MGTTPANDWEWFIAGIPWFLQGRTVTDVGPAHATNADHIDAAVFPYLRRLLEASTTTPVTIDAEDHELRTWVLPDGERLAWLCPNAPTVPPTEVFEDHRDLLASFGGIVERSINEPSSWLMNCNDALTARIAGRDASFLSAYDWMMEDHGGSWPIDPTDYYSICQEANGNETLCHRRDGDVLMFAADHAFDHIDVLDGCPPYSLYRIRRAPTFTTWVEEVARQWAAARAIALH